MKYGFILFQVMVAWSLTAQPVVKVEVSSDTVSVGSTVEVTYTIENGDGQFVLPDMDHLPLISGPNSSSSFMYQNGKMSSNQSYSFTLLAIEEGKLTIPETVYKSGKEEMKINPVVVVIVDEWDKAKPSKQKEEPSKPATTREKRKF
jgi:hypothetical protein